MYSIRGEKGNFTAWLYNQHVSYYICKNYPASKVLHDTFQPEGLEIKYIGGILHNISD